MLLSTIGALSIHFTECQELTHRDDTGQEGAVILLASGLSLVWETLPGVTLSLPLCPPVSLSPLISVMVVVRQALKTPGAWRQLTAPLLSTR